MFCFDTKELENDNSGKSILSKKIEVDENLDCFIIISSENKKILTPLLNKIVDYVLDNLSIKDTYNKLSVTLESVNFLINNVKKKEENNIDDLSIVI
jgi:DNA-binding CsgD family transcriptional regulator